MSLKSDRSEVRRLPSRGHYEPETVYKILDTTYLCHVSFAIEGRPYIIPTAYGRSGDHIYIHGSVKSRMLSFLAAGAEAAIAVTHIDGIVLARSLFHSSMNYRSVVVYGKGEEIADPEEKVKGLKIVSEQIWPGRWDAARIPDTNELKATTVIRLHITEGAAKIRTGPAIDNTEDYALDVWAGIVPVETRFLSPEPDHLLDSQIKIPEHVMNRIRT